MSIHSYQGKQPRLGRDVFVAEGARLVGDVQIGDASSIWFNTVLRGDLHPVIIGHHTNIQDNSVCHVGYDEPCIIGNHVTAGHNVILHGCTIGDEVLIGMGAILMDRVVVGAQSIIGAGALLTQDLVVPPGSLVYGSPAKVVSTLGAKEREQLRRYAEDYCEFAAHFAARAHPQG
ncbi:MAG: gamma carbonic anhydrase family protein [Verrucomicrobia bacterium]|nr:gamma carbonic anhydrase family protein [Verrucomicrobiota bacterium]